MKEKTKSKKKIVSVSKYTFTLTKYLDNSTTLVRENEGFNGFELLGLLSIAQKDIVNQLEGKQKIDQVITKAVIPQQ